MVDQAKVRARFWVESALALSTAILGVITLVWPDWIEILFQVEPDEGSGAVEWAIAFGLALAALLAGKLASTEWRRRAHQSTPSAG